MCLVVLAFRAHPDYPLVVAANRDEFHDRPTEPAHWWASGILAGRDLESGGTWLGVTRNGRFAAVTNFREERARQTNDLSRGHLVSHFLESRVTPSEYMNAIDLERYGGFGLLLSDLQTVGYITNRGDGPRLLSPSIYGLSNHLLDSEWPKVQRARARMAEILGREGMSDALLELLAETDGPDRQRSIFVVDPLHGTRSSTVVIVRANREVEFVERGFSRDGTPLYTSPFGFRGVSAAMAMTPAV